MKKESPKYAQSTLIFRLLAGGYLLYLSWDLRGAIAENPLFIVAIAVFSLIGAALLIHAGWKLFKGDYEGGASQDPPAEDTGEAAEE